MQAIRFRLAGGRKATEYKALRDALEAAAADQISVQESDIRPGAALADIVLVAIINGGTIVVAAAITAFGFYLAAAKQKHGDPTPQPPVMILVRGTGGTQRLHADRGQISPEEIDRVVAQVGTITEIAESD